MYKCKKCGKLVEIRFGSGIFCSRSCANSRKHSNFTKEKISRSIKNNLSGFASIEYRKNTHNKYLQNIEKYNKNPKFCKTCNKKLDYKFRHRTYCSYDCYIKRMQKSGGYRCNSGRSIHGYYKGYYCASTYELVFLIYCLDNNINIKRFNGRLCFNNLKYYPDFIIDNKIIEIKGYHNKNVDRQVFIAKSNGYLIDVKYKTDLEKEFKWVRDHYSYKYLYELYDKFNYKYTYKCFYCNKDFFTMKKRRKEETFCSRECAGKFRNKNKGALV